MASITQSQIGWSTPDGRELFASLDLTFAAEHSGLVGRNGVGKATLLKLITGAPVSTTGDIASDGTLGVVRQRDHLHARTHGLVVVSIRTLPCGAFRDPP